MVYDTAKLLANEIRNSAEYREYASIRARVMENSATRAMIGEYGRLQILAQAAAVAGERESESLKKLQKIGEVLQFDADASAYLMAEYRLKRMLGDVYKTLAEAADVDLGPLEA
jgi:cell fate (sporulation/competence/biofilm development) regulator YlbF (YheA/YmcA/DUF963 family)